MIHFRFCSYAPSLTSQRCQLKELFSSNKGGRTLTPCFFELLEGTTKQAIHISKNRPPPSLQLSLLPTNVSLTWSLTSFYLPALPSIFMRRCYYFGRGVRQYYTEQGGSCDNMALPDSGRKLATWL